MTSNTNRGRYNIVMAVWNDDERDLSDLWGWLDERKRRNMCDQKQDEEDDVVPFHVILKELYDEQRYGLPVTKNKWWTPPVSPKSYASEVETYSSEPDDPTPESSDEPTEESSEEDEEVNNLMLDSIIYKKFCYY